VRGWFALEKFLEQAQRSNLKDKCLDVGCGAGNQLKQIVDSRIFEEVHALNLSANAPSVGEDRYFSMPVEHMHVPDCEDEKYDAVWCCHVLEHTLTPGPFLKAIHSLLKEGGLLCIIVPPLKSEITYGHVTLWNPGLLLLNLLKAGFDCRDIAIKKQGYNIAVILTKKSLPDGVEGTSLGFKPDRSPSAHDFLPKGLKWIQNPKSKKWYYDGDFRSLNWP